jgi:hypothetical protein
MSSGVNGGAFVIVRGRWGDGERKVMTVWPRMSLSRERAIKRVFWTI